MGPTNIVVFIKTNEPIGQRQNSVICSFEYGTLYGLRSKWQVQYYIGFYFWGSRGGAVAPSDLPKKNPIWYCTSHFDLKPFKVPYSKEQITLFCLCFIGFICLFKQNNVCGSHLKTKFLFFLLHVLNFLSDCNFFSLWCLCYTIISFELGYPHNHNNKK